MSAFIYEKGGNRRYAILKTWGSALEYPDALAGDANASVIRLLGDKNRLRHGRAECNVVGVMVKLEWIVGNFDQGYHFLG